MSERSSDISRRELLRGLPGLGAATLATGSLEGCGSSEGGPPFQHGVASGDPIPDGVILWTRISSPTSGTIEVAWEMSLDPAFAELAASGVVETSGERDFTVKADVRGLEPGRAYYYRFRSQEITSVVGRTRTAPQGAVARARFAVASCSSIAQGYFHAYRALALRGDLDAVIHLGDYLYESGPGQYGYNRSPQPPREAITLTDYRTRHAQYKLDPDLQELHRQHAFITVWDDHETADNAWKDGAANHNPSTEGTWAERKASAQQAYAEWMPIREQDPPSKIWRKLTWGSLVDLIMLDTRLWGRTANVSGIVSALPDPDPTRTLLGDDQAAWLEEQVVTSNATWKLVGQQVMVANLILNRTTIVNPDQWHGYPESRRRLVDFLRGLGPSNVVVLTGDIHSSWAAELVNDPNDATEYDPSTGQGAVAVEFVTPGITSPGIPPEYLGAVESARAYNPHQRWFDLVQQGYLILDVVPERVQAAWFLYPDVKRPQASSAVESFAAAWSVTSGSTRLVRDDAAAEAPSQTPPLAP